MKLRLNESVTDEAVDRGLTIKPVENQFIKPIRVDGEIDRTAGGPAGRTARHPGPGAAAVNLSG